VDLSGRNGVKAHSFGHDDPYNLFERSCFSGVERERVFAESLSESLGIKAEIEEASDNFYPTKRNNIKAKLQISNSLKKELITYIGEKKVALASFNFHGNHFSEPFDFSDGGRVVSGCAGFGLERWVSAIQSVRSENE
jgi:hypothetical protein